MASFPLEREVERIAFEVGWHHIAPGTLRQNGLIECLNGLPLRAAASCHRSNKRVKSAALSNNSSLGRQPLAE
jgi:hypothetical protein